jgi:ribonuclease J
MKIHTIGGFSEVGKNMTALEMGDDVLLLDCGLYLPAIVGVKERERNPTEKWLTQIGALPDHNYLKRKNLREKVRSVLVSHAHLDHVGALPYLAHHYKAPIVGPPFATEVLKILLADSNQSIKNKIISAKPNSTFIAKGKKNYKVEFLNVTHSTIQCTLIAVHTPKGIILYANDFKLDNTPIVGDKPNYKRLKALSKIGIKALIIDALYAPKEIKTPSEKIARNLLEGVLFTTDNRKSGMVITTFSSHIARLKSIVEFGRKLGRKVILLGRSLNKYATAAERIGQLPFKGKAKIFSYKRQVASILKKVNKNRADYLVVCTGHQGEPGSILDRLSRNDLPFRFKGDNHVIFASRTIPSHITLITCMSPDTREERT